MKAPLIARVLGIALLVATIAAVIPFATVPAGPTAEYIQVSTGYVLLFGLFPVNTLHDALHGLLGVWGVAASFFSFRAAVRYCRWVVCIYGLLVILGAIPITNTLFGLVPIYGHDIWLHVLVVALAVWGGFLAGSVEPMGEEAALMPPPTG